MSTIIGRKIIGYKVLTLSVEEQLTIEKDMKRKFEFEHIHENISRPEVLKGYTYKVVSPQSEHAMYITINNMVLNLGTDDEHEVPYEMFINCKNMDQFQWITALTRVISAVFRKGGDVCFLVDELKSVFDPKGGYFKKGGIFIPSIVAEIGYAVETHLKTIGIIKDIEMDEGIKKLIDEKKIKISDNYLAKATVCKMCYKKSVVILDGCSTCLECGDSKCG